MDQIIIFAATKRSTEKAGLKKTLSQLLHGDLLQSKRNRIVQTRNGKCKILVATDVAARGLDVPAISHVINYDLPRQTEDYVHRIGRCGRAGRTGVAISLCSMDDRPQLAAINRYLDRKMDVEVIEGLEPKKTYVPSANNLKVAAAGVVTQMVVVKDADVQVAMPVSLMAVEQRLATTAVIKAKAQASHVTHLVSQKTVSAASLIKASAVALIAAMLSAPREIAATGRGRPSGSQGRPANRSGGNGRPSGNRGNRGGNS